MSNYLSIVTGDDADLSFTLYDSNGAPKDVSSATSIKASVRSRKDTVEVGPVTLSSGATGASWSTGVVVVELTSAQTDDLTSGLSTMEIQVDDGGKLTWLFKVLVKQGKVA